MNLRAFEQLAREYWEEIPEDYKRGVDGVRVVAQAKGHDTLPDVYTMGECVTEAYPSDFGGPDTIRSAVVIYYGSFMALAGLGHEGGVFDWEGELWETLTHELQHHLESLADEDSLEDFDYAADENFKRYEGQPFDPTFYHAGDLEAGADAGAWLRIEGVDQPIFVGGARVETDWFFELQYSSESPPSGPALLDWAGARHAFELPFPRADVTFVILGDWFEPRPLAEHAIDEVCIVLVRKASLWRGALDALLGRTKTTEQVEVAVRTIGDQPGE